MTNSGAGRSAGPARASSTSASPSPTSRPRPASSSTFSAPRCCSRSARSRPTTIGWRSISACIRAPSSAGCGCCGWRRGLRSSCLNMSAPDQDPPRPRNSDAGGHHLAFYVTDMDAALAHLRRHGVDGSRRADDDDGGRKRGPDLGLFPRPWGLQLELVSAPTRPRLRAAGRPADVAARREAVEQAVSTLCWRLTDMPVNAPRIAFVGTGAQGASIGADFALAGHDVTFIEQWPAHVEAIRAERRSRSICRRARSTRRCRRCISVRSRRSRSLRSRVPRRQSL